MKLKTEIFLFLFITGLSVILITGGLFYFNAKRSFLLQIENQLESLSETKKLRLEAILQKKKEELYQIKINTVLKQNLYLFLLEKSDKYIKNSYGNLINNFLIRELADIPSLKKIHIINKSGKVIFSSDTENPPFKLDYLPCLKGIDKGVDCFQGITRHGINFICLSGTISYKKITLGTVIIESDANELLSITGDYTGLGKTGETTIAQKISKDSAIFLTPLRFKSNSAFKIGKSSGTPQVIFQALEGVEKFFSYGTDYRQTPVIASTRFIKETGWGIVTKIDVREALIPVREFKTLSYKITLIAIVILGLISLIFAWKIVIPINRISAAAKRISSGELGLIVAINKTNELGNLAMCFNNMTQSLILAQKKLEEKVLEINRSNVALEKFAYIVSHDLKAPLSAIGSLAEIITMENHTKLDGEGIKLLGMLQTKVKQMHDLINGILEYSKIDHNGAAPEVVNLTEIIHYIIDTLSPPNNVIIKIDTDLPQIFFEKVLIIQLFQNLISNAIKYNNKAEKIISIGYQQESLYHTFYVKDNGIGIDEKYYDKIFDIFTTLQSKGNGSTGIGLAIVKKIIENKGGSVYLTSKPRHGSTFYIKIPVSNTREEVYKD